MSGDPSIDNPDPNIDKQLGQTLGGTFGSMNGGKGTVSQDGLAPPVGPFQKADPNADFGQAYQAPDPGRLMQLGEKDATFKYSDQGAYQDPNATDIFHSIFHGLDDRANTAAPVQGAVSQFAGSQNDKVANVNSAQINTAQDNNLQAGQNKNINALALMAQGLGPSVAANQARVDQERNVAQQMAILGSQRGASNPAIAMRQAAMGAAAAANTADQNAVTGRIQEQLGAQSALTNALGQDRGQSQAIATAQSGLDQQADLTNAGAQNNTMNMNASNLQGAGLNNANALNSANLQDQQVKLQQNSQNNQEYNAMLQAYMGQSQQGVTNAEAYQNALAQEQEAIGNWSVGQQAQQAGFNQQDKNSAISGGTQAAAALIPILMAALA